MHSARGPGHLVAGRYRLLHQLGRGAMGIVWRGRDELLDRDVAVKQIVPAPMASADEARDSYQRTLREARTAARLSHPGVITVFDVAEEDGMPWIVMELITARPLDQVIAEDGPLTPAQAAQSGGPAATWTFWWEPASGARIDVTKLIFTAQTSAGPQPYVLSMSAPAPQAAAAAKVFTVAKGTFRPLPG